MKVNGIEKEFIVDTGSPISIMPADESILKKTEMQKIKHRYQDVNKNEFPDLFKNNTTIKDTEINTQLKPGHYSVKQKERPIPLHLQEAVGKELEKLEKTGHLEKVKHVDEDFCFSGSDYREK